MGNKASEPSPIDDLAYAIKANRDNDMNNSLLDIKRNLANTKTKKKW